ncbi:MsnO8 family LLM class oxidoreductase [Paenibacillus sp. M2]|uniref:MsnO8 family LLM class oxidoreductase n=1 Tax=Paenibacillus sp. M2 TaxID=3341793 RepID=UPI003989D490
MPGIASSATSVVIGYLAGGTKTIRLGSGGIMLPNHAPLVIAEQFGTLESLYPGRIDLGLGRAPGSDRRTSLALRKDLNSGEDFPELLAELRRHTLMLRRRLIMHLFAQFLERVEYSNFTSWGPVISVHVWQVSWDCRFAFCANHFSPDYTRIALGNWQYRNNFQSSESLKEPHVIVGVNAVVADTDEEAAWLGTTMQQQFLNIIRGTTGLVQPPAEMEGKEVDGP